MSIEVSGIVLNLVAPVAIGDGGTGAVTAADARTNLGLGSMAVQNADNVEISGGSISGVSFDALDDIQANILFAGQYIVTDGHYEILYKDSGQELYLIDTGTSANEDADKVLISSVINGGIDFKYENIPHTVRVFKSTDVGSNNSESLSLGWNGNTAEIGPVQTGAGVQRAMRLTHVKGSTGSGTALLGASNSPASVLSAPYRWLEMTADDGTTVYIPAWK